MFLVNSSLFAKRGYSLFNGTTGTYSGYPGLSSLITTDPRYYQFNWTCPEGVSKVSVLAIGGGGGGSTYRYAGTIAYPTWNAGGGGGLAWVNDIPVTPGLVYTVVVSRTSTKSQYSTANTGYDSYFKDVDTVKGGGATANNNTYSGKGLGGTYIANSSYGTYGGGNGGDGGIGKSGSINSAGAGGGAGGYAGYGGAGARGPTSSTQTQGNSGSAGQVGSGAGGGGGTSVMSTTAYANPGGGVGIYGLGATGAGGYGSNLPTSGSSAQPGGAGSGGSGITYGGGGAGGASALDTLTGGAGVVRIIWGAGRAFPSTDVSGV
jgi:hypothetical protein